MDGLQGEQHGETKGSASVRGEAEGEQPFDMTY